MVKIDCNKLKKSIGENLEKLVIVLEKYGFKNPRMTYDNKIRCGWDEKSKGDGIIISNCEKIIVSYTRFSTGETGDIISLIMLRTNKKFMDVIKELYKVFNSEYDSTNIDFLEEDILEKISSFESLETMEYEVLPENCIGKPEISLMLLKDRILPTVQLKYKLWYHEYENRICFNWRDINGNLVGVNGRLNMENVPDEVPKYLPPLNIFRKGLHLYGLYENKKYIQKNKKVIVFEAEKSVLQCDGYGLKACVAIGSASITLNQLKLLVFVGVKEVIFAFDDGLEIIDKNMKKIAHLCKENNLDIKLRYIYDKERKVLTEKASPSDLGAEILALLLKDYTVDYEVIE